jgi:hypothetical protein
MWTFQDLDDDELRQLATADCTCRPRPACGMWNGFMCGAHRAKRELIRRETWISTELLDEDGQPLVGEVRFAKRDESS